jgi:hypothetical protein
MLPAIFLLVSVLVYLPLSITEHLTRQYAAGSLVILGLSFKRPVYLLICIVMAGSIHMFALLLAPVAISIWAKKELMFIVCSSVLTLYFSTIGDIVDVASYLFVQVSWCGEMLRNEFLKSAAFRFNIYVQGFSQNFGYPEISFRGIIASFLFLSALSVRFRERQFVYTGFISAFIVMLWIIFMDNDLISHRIYHYIREIAIVPTCCSIFIVLRYAYNWIDEKYFGLEGVQSP